jgi:two-component system, OmpR family, phosphate regulon sensor histidine kinase PhoR
MQEALKKVKAFKGSQKDGIGMMLEEVQRFTQSPISYFAIVDESTQVFTMLGWSKSVMENCALITKPIVYVISETGIWGDAYRERRACIENDYPNCTKPTKKGQPKGHVNVKRHMNVPCFAKEEDDEIIGVLGVGNKAVEYTEADAKLMQQFIEEAWPILEELD